MCSGPAGEQLPPGEIGGIYLRTPTGPLATYVGNDVKPMDTTADGFTSVGDLGWLDEDGFLYMADRRVDMIVTGARQRLPGRGRGGPQRAPRHRRRGGGGVARPRVGPTGARHRPPVDPTLDAEGVIAFARDRLAPYKVPKSVEFVDSIPRSEAMKFNRAALVEERDGPDRRGCRVDQVGQPTDEDGRRRRRAGGLPRTARYSVAGPPEARPAVAIRASDATDEE